MTTILRLVLPHGLMLLASVALYWAATLIDVRTGGTHRIGPDAWPKAIIVFMGLLCAWEIVRRLVMRPAHEDAAADTGGASAGFRPRLLAAGVAIVLGYVIAVTWLGFFVTTAAFLALFTWVGGLRRPLLVAATSLAGSLLLVFIFMRVAYISLPLGEGPFRALSLALLQAFGVR